MRVFLTGATGFIGSAIVKELIGAGHQVLGLTRSDAGASALLAAGAEVHRGTLEDLDSLKSGAAAADGVIHTAFIHDFSDYAGNCLKDRLAIEAMGSVLVNSGKPFVITSGIALLKPGHLGTEDMEGDLNAAAAGRLQSEIVTLALAAHGVRSSVVRLPPSVHGDGDHGFVPMIINIAREKGVSAYIGEGLNRWPAVHRLDAARLFRLALENGIAGSRYHGVGDEGVPILDIANVIGKQLNLPVVSKSFDEAPAHFGWMGHFLAVDCPASSAKTQEWLGWKPTHTALIEDLEHGTYFNS